MIVLLDTTELMRDPWCNRLAWRVLAQAASAWNLRVVVSEVVIAEAVAGYQRRIDDVGVAFHGFVDKHFGPLVHRG